MKQSGLTLVELLFVLAIIAILAAIAVPSYAQYIGKQNIKRAQSDLEFMSTRLENRYQRVLAHPTTDHNDTAALKVLLKKWSPTSETDEFNFSSENASTTSYTLKATAVAGRAKDCVVSLYHDGKKEITNCAELAPDGKWL